MANRVVYFNGQFVPESQARVSIFDSALMFGDMAFEMTRTYRHKTFRLRDHIHRLYAALKLMEIDCGLSMDEMEEVTEETVRRNTPTEADDVDWQIMHDVSRGPLPAYRVAFSEEIRPTISINCWPLMTHTGRFASNYETGVNLVVPSQQAVPAHLLDPKAKTRSRLHYQLANLQGGRLGNAWPVMLDPDGFLAEGTGWNIFLVRDGVLYTPEPRNILLGVSRRTTIELANKLGIKVCETNMGRWDALQADEMFCTATTFSIVHACSFEGQPIGDGQPGPVFERLINAWKDFVGLDFVAQAQEYATRLDDWEKRECESSQGN
jgi:branched-chain amino acid aminotransferase